MRHVDFVGPQSRRLVDNWQKAALLALLAGFSSLIISAWNFEMTQVDVAELKVEVRDLEKQLAQLEGATRAREDDLARRLKDLDVDSEASARPASRPAPARRCEDEASC